MDVKETMSSYVAFLRALSMIHQNNHWLTKGNNFYGNHLLFQRIYETTQENTDEAAERTIGLYGDLNLKSDLIKETIDKFKAEHFENNAVKSSLMAEKAFQALSEILYNNLKEKNHLTLGLDDLLMSIANKHEVHIYLLQNALTSE